MKPGLRIGYGFDVHPLVEDRPFWLGGVLIPHNKGALGHSDADVLIHALCDALLGAAGLSDIGHQFPDTDPAFKGIDSKILLRETIRLINEKGYAIVNADVSLNLEKPKIKPHIPAMKSTLCPILGISTEELSIKATTMEKMGFIGREEGLTASAVVLLYKI